MSTAHAQHAGSEVRGAAVATAPLAVSMRDVRRTYPARHGSPARVALHSITLAIPKGQRVALLGPNGSGKSTLLRILSTLDRPDADSPGAAVEILGLPLSPGAVRFIRARIGVVFQNPGLDPILTVKENLSAQASLVGISGRLAAARIERAASDLGLTDRLGERVRSLSGGLARRADLARALLHDPELLLLDEPTTGLDPRARVEFLATVHAVAEARSAGPTGPLGPGGDARRDGTQVGEARGPAGSPLTVIMSTHLMEEAEHAERVVLLHEGRIVADAGPAELRARVGGSVIRCRATPGSGGVDQARELLSGHGLEVTTDPLGTVVARAPSPKDPALAAAVVSLVNASIPFEVGPPTLADAFLALTGAPLQGPENTGNEVPSGRGRRGGRSRRA